MSQDDYGDGYAAGKAKGLYKCTRRTFHQQDEDGELLIAEEREARAKERGLK